MSLPVARRQVSIASPVLGEAELDAVREVLESGWLTQGPRVAAFEADFAARHQVEHALATTSCTTALQLALAALGIGPGDEVIVPAFTWVATANVVVHCGATPVFVDVSPTTYNVTAEEVARQVSSRTRAVIVVHLFGMPADVPAIRQALPEGVAIVEDAACAAGASWDEVPVGGLGDIACFSFHPRKSITTGEGGMLTTNDPALATRATELRNHGAKVSEEDRHRGPRPWELPAFEEIGFNFRMTDIQAAIGIVQLAKLDDFIAYRATLASEYDHALGELGWLSPPSVSPRAAHGWQAYVCTVEGGQSLRDAMLAELEDKGIAGRPGTHAVTSLEVYRRRGTDASEYPIASGLAESTIALPLHNAMGSEDQAYVIAALREMRCAG